jgi:hypothetical protein
VQLINGDNVSVMANTASSTALDCHYCHRGNTVAGDPNPDLAPAYYGSGGNTGTDGYPNHHVDGTPDNVVNPGDPPHLGTIDNTNRVYQLRTVLFLPRRLGQDDPPEEYQAGLHRPGALLQDGAVGGRFRGGPDPLLGLPRLPRQRDKFPLDVSKLHFRVLDTGSLRQYRQPFP